MEVTRRRGRRRRKLLDDLKDRRGYSHLKEEALDLTMWRNRFRGGFGPVVRQNTEWMNPGEIYWYVVHYICQSLGVSSTLCILELSRPIRIDTAVKNTNILCNTKHNRSLTPSWHTNTIKGNPSLHSTPAAVTGYKLRMTTLPQQQTVVTHSHPDHYQQKIKEPRAPSRAYQ